MSAERNPIRKTSRGWYWGSQGPFPTREKALSVMRAAFASGYRGRGRNPFGFRIGDKVQTIPLGPSGAWRMKGTITGFQLLPTRRPHRLLSNAILDHKKVAPISLLEKDSHPGSRGRNPSSFEERYEVRQGSELVGFFPTYNMA